MKLKQMIAGAAIALALTAGQPAKAITYTDGDVLLIFRADTKNNVEFNLGNISQFLNKSNGYTVAVTNWNLGVVTNTYALTNGNVQFAVIAASNPAVATAAWITDSQPLVAANDVTPTAENILYSKISGVGIGATNDNIQSEAPPGTNYINLNPSGTTAPNSFDYIASNGGQNPSLLATLGGSAGVTAKVTGVTPTTVLFYEIDASGPPRPAATLIGSFTLTPNGALTFRAGPLLDAPLITAVGAGNGKASVTFAPKQSVKYRLLYSTQLNSSRTNWTIVGSPVAGGGTSTTNLTDNTATGAARFYSVQSYP